MTANLTTTPRASSHRPAQAQRLALDPEALRAVQALFPQVERLSADRRNVVWGVGRAHVCLCVVYEVRPGDLDVVRMGS